VCRRPPKDASRSDELEALFDDAARDTIERLEATGSPVVTDGEQRKPSFATYPIDGLDTLAPNGVVIPFADGHTRQLPVITAGPFRYRTHADSYVTAAQRFATRPLKQAVISASALSLLYPADGIDGYPRDAFVADLLDESEADIRGCLAAGADSVQIDFTEGRLSLKLDPSGGLLRNSVELNNQALDRFDDGDRRRIGTQLAADELGV
jgi:5-methyltetrahydropteroyltriglutamate--homocysteine methyltransferase